MTKYKFRPHALLLLLPIILSACTLSVNKPQSAGVFYSNTEGVSWEHRVFVGQDKKKTVTIASYDIGYFVFHPNDEQILYVSTKEAGIFKTIDKGLHWMQTPLSQGYYPSFVIDPKTPTIQYAASGGTVLKSTDDGATWAGKFIEQPGISITAIGVNPDRPNIIWAANSRGGLLKSEDFGNNWELITMFTESVRKFVFSERDSQVMYLLLSGLGFTKSTDGGKTWTFASAEALSGFPGSLPFQSFQLRPNTLGDIVTGSAYGFMRSTDGGETWKAIETVIPFGAGVISNALMHPSNPDKLFFTSGNTFYSSTDGGTTWKTLQTIPTEHIITSLTFHPLNDQELFAGITKIKKK